MSQDTKIEWTDAVWNPVTGCTKISEGCEHCYAERMAKRLAGRYGYPADEPFRVTLHHDRLHEPQGWKKPRRVFVCSMADLFHEDVPEEFIREVLVEIGLNQGHTFLLLTKRVERMAEVFARLAFEGDVFADHGDMAYPDFFPNLWLGATVENQDRADERVSQLLQIPAAIHFSSHEPALGPVDWSRWLGSVCLRCGERYCGESERWRRHSDGRVDHACYGLEHEGTAPTFAWAKPRLRLIITGGETGPGARPMHPDWARNDRDQAIAAGAAFFFKQWGDWVPGQAREMVERRGEMIPGWCHYQNNDFGPSYQHNFGEGIVAARVGKKHAGRLLDGRLWEEMPA